MAYGSYRGGVWSEVDVGAVLQDPSKGLLVQNHFDEVIGSVKYTVTDTTGTGALGTVTPGGVFVITTTTTADQGSQIQELASPFFPTALRPIYGETRVKFSDGDQVQYFFGLASADTTIFASGALSTSTVTEAIGFYMDSTSIAAKAGYLQFTSHTAAGATDTLTASDFLIPDGVWIRLSMKIDVSKLEATLEMLNESTGAISRKVVALTAANIPNAAAVRVSLAAHSEATTASTVTTDLYRYFQPS